MTWSWHQVCDLDGVTCRVIPVAVHEIRSTRNGTTFGDSMVVSTIAGPGSKYWGDVAGQRTRLAWDPPNGIVNVDDVMANLMRFKKSPGAPPLTWVDLGGQRPNLTINVTDLQHIILAFQDKPYPFSAPADCP